VSEVKRLAGRDWHRVRRGVYVERRAYDALDDLGRHRLAVHAVLLKVTADVAVSHVSAAVLHGLPVYDPDLTRVHVTRPDLRSGRDEAGVRFHVATVLDEERHVVDGAPVLSLARTAVDVARDSDLRRGVVTADAALARGTTRDQLLAVVQRCSVWQGTRTAGRVVAFADGRSESVGESLTRVSMAEDGLPAPELQWTLRDRTGFVGRVDFWFPGYRTVVEFDGLFKYKVTADMSPEQASACLVAEKARERTASARWGSRSCASCGPTSTGRGGWGCSYGRRSPGLSNVVLLPETAFGTSRGEGRPLGASSPREASRRLHLVVIGPAAAGRPGRGGMPA
jgi:hypothetical protein